MILLARRSRDWGVETQQVPSIVAVVLLATFPPFRHLLRKCHLPLARGGKRLYLVGKVVLSLLRRTNLSAPLVKGGWHGEAVTGGWQRGESLFRYDSTLCHVPTLPSFASQMPPWFMVAAPGLHRTVPRTVRPLVRGGKRLCVVRKVVLRLFSALPSRPPLSRGAGTAKP